jgi:hypothetical protein
MRARIYVSEHDVYKVKIGAPSRLQVEGFFRKWDTRALTIAPVSSEIGPALAEPTKFKGLSPPNFYLVDLLVANPDGKLKPGMAGLARIYGQRRSLAGLAWQELTRFFARKVW